MNAIKMIMSWLEGLAAPDWQMHHCDGEVQFIAKETLTLLKEQEEQIKNCDESLEKAREEIKWLRGMLKEQEAVPVIQREVMHMLVWCCGSCGVAITDGDKFCRMCGKQAKWE